MRVLVDVLIKLHAHNCVCQIKDLESKMKAAAGQIANN